MSELMTAARRMIAAETSAHIPGEWGAASIAMDKAIQNVAGSIFGSSDEILARLIVRGVVTDETITRICAEAIDGTEPR